MCKSTIHGKRYLCKSTIHGKSYLCKSTVQGKNYLCKSTVHGKSYLYKSTVYGKSYLCKSTVRGKSYSVLADIDISCPCLTDGHAITTAQHTSTFSVTSLQCIGAGTVALLHGTGKSPSI
ncbi:hypothetical protein GQ43DRAFT_3693 [Delitschia confertaspora ATCC 74209]|uniref:Uncharacterized protein n=1 Tax=Delitschia confertaspora ATCC 74209 TaxID=1513339 RepID=A0A9P4JXD7_9PLEO|nr:hypothetical protein GQ43DRAFT_3693 [Delitschia confertaspora ATCC 74209]